MQSLPKGYGRALLQVARPRAVPQLTRDDIAETSAQVKDGNFRIETAADGIHVYNRDGHHVAEDAFALFDKLGVETDGAHAFYLGAELMKAEIAFQLGKRYAQDEAARLGLRGRSRARGSDAAQPRRATRCARANATSDSMPMIREAIVTTVNASASRISRPSG